MYHGLFAELPGWACRCRPDSIRCPCWLGPPAAVCPPLEACGSCIVSSMTSLPSACVLCVINSSGNSIRGLMFAEAKVGRGQGVFGNHHSPSLARSGHRASAILVIIIIFSFRGTASHNRTGHLTNSTPLTGSDLAESAAKIVTDWF
jgi:hypothetical protein